MTEIETVEFDPAFKEEFKLLNLAWIEEHFHVESKDLQQLTNPEREILAEGGQIFFIRVDGIVAGTCALIKISENVFELAKMAVTPSARGFGLGSRLMRASIAWAKKCGAQKIIILSNTALEPAIALYLKFGFKTVRLGPNPDYDRCNIEMELLLE